MIRAHGADAVREAEEPLLAAGVPLMRQAARAVAVTVMREIRARDQRVPGSVVLALVGGGNNGGDALWAAADLARRGVAAHAALCGATAHGEGLAAARAAGVRVTRVTTDGEPDLAGLLAVARRAGVWIDGLAGIGLTGPLREPLAGIVAALEAERRAAPDEPVVVAVDVPSGVVDSGAVPGEVLRAHVTVTMGTPKPALLLPPACAAAGRVEVVDLALPLGEGTVAARRLGAADVADLYPWPRRDDHKYTRGVVGVWAGSETYHGAAHLACAGALATGPGMVRYLGPVATVREEHPEVVTAPGRLQGALVGPGMTPDEAALAALRDAAVQGVPLVVDAGALPALGRVDRIAPTIVTPHAGELAVLLGTTRGAVEADPATAARTCADALGVTVLLKGPVTVVVAPGGLPYSQDGGTAWLASAGSGDVLAGVLAALVALLQTRAEHEERALVGADLALAGAAAAWIHAQAGLRAARARVGEPLSGGPLTASAVARSVPAVLAGLAR